MSIKMTRRDFLKATGAAAAGAQLLSINNAFADPNKPAKYSTKLPQRTLGRTGVKVSMLGLGGAWSMGQSESDDKCVEIIHAAIDLGINYLDTAPNYQKSEKRFGIVMAKRRKEVFLATKVEERTYDGAMKQIENSLKDLQTDHIDLIQLHHIYEKEDVKPLIASTGAIKAFEKMRDQKVIRFIGVTGHPQYAPVVDALKLYPWDTFLGFVNPRADTAPFYTDQCPLARKKGMGIIAMKAYGGGQPAELVGPKDNQAPAPELLRYALSKQIAGKPIDVAIVAVSNVEQLKQNIEAVKNFVAMPQAQCLALEARIQKKA